VIVADDGPGFDGAQISDCHGLALIRGRLELLYGRDATLSFDRTAGSTEVVLDVPAADA
jgi:LytS/YehU family sensor histidine kinase